jgi:hypothetical protein
MKIMWNFPDSAKAGKSDAAIDPSSSDVCLSMLSICAEGCISHPASVRQEGAQLQGGMKFPKNKSAIISDIQTQETCNQS